MPTKPKRTRAHLATVGGVRFTLVTEARPGDIIMTPAQASAYMLELRRNARKARKA